MHQHDHHEVQAIIYVHSDNLNIHTERCADYIHRLGYALAAVVVDDQDGGRWHEAAGMLLSGDAQVLVVAERDELPPDRLPRVDVVAEERRRRLSPALAQRCRPRLVR